MILPNSYQNTKRTKTFFSLHFLLSIFFSTAPPAATCWIHDVIASKLEKAHTQEKRKGKINWIKYKFLRNKTCCTRTPKGAKRENPAIYLKNELQSVFFLPLLLIFWFMVNADVKLVCLCGCHKFLRWDYQVCNTKKKRRVGLRSLKKNFLRLYG